LPSGRCSQILSFRCLDGFSFALDATMLTPLSDSGPVYPELDDQIGLPRREEKERESRMAD
jgi:hypothetical protein